MEILNEIWSPVLILLAAFMIGWAAEAAQTFIPAALALTVLAWLQTLPEFAVEAHIAWNQQRDLMIANLTGSLRLLVGLGWPMIFCVHFFSRLRRRKIVTRLKLEGEDSLSVLFLFISIVYFLVILFKATLTCWDAVFLTAIYGVYLYLAARMPVGEQEDFEDLPWVSKKIVQIPGRGKVMAVILFFVLGGIGLYISVEPFIHTLQKWSVTWGISTFVFVQWIAPFLSEFPEKVTAFNWARQENKAPMALMNMVSSNINQWTLLAAMIPVLFNLSLGHFEPVILDPLHRSELALTIAQSFLGGILLLDMELSWIDALIIFVLWVTQFINSSLRWEVTLAYSGWAAIEILKLSWAYYKKKELPHAFTSIRQIQFR